MQERIKKTNNLDSCSGNSGQVYSLLLSLTERKSMFSLGKTKKLNERKLAELAVAKTKLEAAAPKLLKVCKTMAIYWEGSDALIATQLREAITEATE